MTIVKFHAVDEFIAELQLDRLKVEGKVLRVTNGRRRGEAYISLTLIATAVVGDTIARLDYACGEYMFDHGQEFELTHTRGGQAMKKVTDAAAAMGLEVRHGLFEAA